jgi:U3 small nucleolar RNA-associated protein 20
MTTHLSAEVVETFLVHILTPVYRITEDDSVRDSRMGAFMTAQSDPFPTDDRAQMS